MMKFEERKNHREAAFEEWQKIRMMMRRRFIIKRIMFSAIIIALLLTVMLTAAFNIGHGESVHSLTSPVEVSILSEAPPTQWNKTYGGPSSDWASALVQTSDGGFAIACSTSSYGAGSADAWLIKLVIPEFPLATILLVLMALITLTVAFVKKKRFQENRRPKSSAIRQRARQKL